MTTHYERLGVAKTASADDVRRAFRERAKAAHPDAGGDAAAFRALCEARDVLVDPGRRRLYDASLLAPDGAAEAWKMVEEFVGPIDSAQAEKVLGDLFEHMLGRAKRELGSKLMDELRKRGMR